MSNDIQKRQVLPDSKMPVAKGVKVKPIKGPKYDAGRDLKKYGLAPTETLEYTDQFTGEKKSITIDRRGTTEEKVAITLVDPKATREQKDAAVSMYLFEKGKHGASMLMDLWAYKGAHTKESRAFQSTMRFDFELFLQTFQMFMQDSADLVFDSLPLEVVEVEDKDGKTKDIVKVKAEHDVDATDVALTLGKFAQYHRMTSALLGKRIRAEVQKRERAKGKGIYIGLDNKPYSIYEDEDVVEVVRKDKEEANKKHE